MSLIDAELLERAIRYAVSRENFPMPRWTAVMDTFLIGSTEALALCRRFHLDPDEDIWGRTSGEQSKDA